MAGRRWAFLVAVVSVAGVAVAAVGGGATAPTELPVRVQKGVTYSTAGGEDLQLDLAVPATGGPYPAVLMLHGGAWRLGSRGYLSQPGKDAEGRPTPSVIESLAARGYVVAAASYRLAPKHKFPAQVEDARAAVKFLRANAKKFNIDPDHIGALGFSAGAHLALLLGTTDPAADLDSADDPGRVQCVVDFFGPTDLKLYAATPGLEEAYMVPWLGKECRTDPAVYKKASPIEYVSKNTPPVLMVHGTADLMVPIIHSERMLAKLRDAGVPAELVTVKGGMHGWGREAVARSADDVVRFLDEHLKGKK